MDKETLLALQETIKLWEGFSERARAGESFDWSLQKCPLCKLQKERTGRFGVNQQGGGRVHKGPGVPLLHKNTRGLDVHRRRVNFWHEG